MTRKITGMPQYDRAVTRDSTTGQYQKGSTTDLYHRAVPQDSITGLPRGCTRVVPQSSTTEQYHRAVPQDGTTGQIMP